mgnify:CR=1 FL=1
MSNPRRILLAFAAVLISTTAWAAEIAPGVEYTVYNLPHPNVAHVVKIDLSRPEYKLKLGFPQKKRNYTARETTSTIANRYDAPPSHDVLAAVNGSFFSTGIGITGTLINSNGFIQLPNSSWETYIFTDARTSRIERNVSSSGNKVTFANGASLAIDQVDLARADGQLVCYTMDWDTSTRTTTEGAEVILSNVSYPMRPDKEVMGTVTSVRTGAQSLNNVIPAGGLVLSAHGAKASTLAANVAVGDQLRIYLDTNYIIYNNARFGITGAGWILANGAANTAQWSNFSDSFKGRHPRTLIGWNATHLFLVAVDGRQSFSVGMTFQEMADFMLSIGATDAINLDGGGSTTMVVNGTVRNSPSDGSQRAVGNAVLLVKQDTASTFPMQDSFPSTGRSLPWEDKFRYNGVSAFSPTSPGGDGYVTTVKDPAGGGETIHVGDLADTDYAVEADIYCQYRPEVSSNGYERYGIFARDNGNFAFTLTSFGGGNCYLMTYDTNNGRIRVGKVVNGAFTDFLASAPLYYTTSAWRKMRIECVGSSIRYYLDGAPIAHVVDSTFARGYAGIGFHEFFSTNSNMLGTRADNFRVTALPSVPSISQTKQSPIGTEVYLNDVVVTAAFPAAGMFYVRDGAMGIGVQKNSVVSSMPSVGSRVVILGRTAYAGAPYSKEVIVVPTGYMPLGGTGDASPVAMNNRASGGGPLGRQSGVADNVSAVPPVMSSNLNGIGSLVTVWGRLTSGGGPGERLCWIDDGSNLNDGAGQGIRVDLSEIGSNLPGSAEFYRITGIMRCGTSSGPEALPIRVLWPRTASDIIPAD